jgi:hypothetical protein
MTLRPGEVVLIRIDFQRCRAKSVRPIAEKAPPSIDTSVDAARLGGVRHNSEDFRGKTKC